MTLQLSVIIPTHDRPQLLARCLEALSAQRLPRDAFEVCVIDDGGQADLASAMAPWRARLQLVLERQARAGPASARNRGLQAARAPLVAFTDDDCAPEPGWAEALLRASAQQPGALLGGQTVNGLPGNLYAEASQLLVDYLYRALAGRREAPRFFTSNNLAAPRLRLQELGGFDPSFPRPAGEDRELCDRWLQQGLPMAFVDDARVRHHHDLDLRGYLRQHLAYGRGAYQLRQARRQRGRAPLEFERARFYLELVSSPFGEVGPRRAVALSTLLVASQAAHTLGFLLERRSAAAPREPR